MRCVLSAERASHCSAAFFVRCRSSFSLSKVSSLFSFEAEKRTKKTHKIVLGAFDQNTKISKAPSFSSLGEDGHARSSSLVCLVWYVRTSVVFLLLFLCSNAFTKRRRRRGVSSRARSARARRRVDEKGVERGWLPRCDPSFFITTKDDDDDVLERISKILSHLFALFRSSLRNEDDRLRESEPSNGPVVVRWRLAPRSMRSSSSCLVVFSLSTHTSGLSFEKTLASSITLARQEKTRRKDTKTR